MGDYRSESYFDGRIQRESSYGNRPSSNPQDLRAYSSSYDAASYAAAPPPTQMGGVKELKKGKSKTGPSLKSWSFNDPEFQRKKRVVSYKSYAVEGKVKGSLRKSFRWLKDRYTHMVHGWW